jgi:hypothetical protein
MDYDYLIRYREKVDFCVWVLEVDGLHVPPFDRHQNGSGALRSAGLDAGNWQRWLGAVASDERAGIMVERRIDQLSKQLHDRVEADIQAREAPYTRLGAARKGAGALLDQVKGAWAIPAPPSASPPRRWHGPPEVGEQLEVLWKAFRKFRGPKARRATSLYGEAMSRFLRSPESGAWRELMAESYPDPRAQPCFYVVRYPGPAALLTEGSGIVLGTRGWDASPETVAEFLASAARGSERARESE